MTYARAAVAALGGALVMWLLAGAWHEIVASRLYADRIQDEHQGVGLIFLAYCVLALLMTFFLRHARLSQRPLVQGAVLGSVIGILWVFPHELALAAAHGEPLGYVFVNAAWHVVEQGTGGIVIAVSMYVLARVRRPPLEG